MNAGGKGGATLDIKNDTTISYNIVTVGNGGGVYNSFGKVSMTGGSIYEIERNRYAVVLCSLLSKYKAFPRTIAASAIVLSLDTSPPPQVHLFHFCRT